MKKLKTILAITVLAILTSCSKSDNEVAPVPPVIGYDYVLTNEFRGANNALILWKDGIATDFTNGSEDIIGIDMQISGSDVYILANVTLANGGQLVRVWKNGVPTNITAPSGYITARAMAISGNDVYIVGEDTNLSNGSTNVAFWKNGVKTNLLSSVYYSIANGIKIIGNDVYIIGQIINTHGNGEAAYWKNGVITNITAVSSTIQTETVGMDVVGADVYIAGTHKDFNIITNKRKPYYWKNQTQFQLDASAGTYGGDEYANDIKVSGNDIYVVGEIVQNQKFKAVIWKNNIPTIIDPNAYISFAEKIQLKANNIYVGGNRYLSSSSKYATVYKNTVHTDYITNNATGSEFVAMHFK